MTDSTEGATQSTEISDDLSGGNHHDIVGTDEPVHRTNAIHPLTGKQDSIRTRIGDRRRIEALEFKIGHVICGHKSNLTGNYCTTPPEPGIMRCNQHRAPGNPVRGPNPHYSMISHVFQRCSLCKIKECDDKNDQKGASECVIERDIFENMMIEAQSLEKYGETTKHMFEQLIWNRVLLYRAYAQLAAEGLTVTEIIGFTQQGDEIVPLRNDREHPVLKHIARLLQADKQLCDALELTPAAKTRKGESDAGRDAQTSFASLFKQSFMKFRENDKNGDDNQ